MTSRNTHTLSLADFQRLLDVSGADRTRWPLALRASAAARLAADAKARRLLAEAEALESVLLSAPEPDVADVIRLSDRIMAAAVGASQDVAGPAQAVPIAVARRSIKPAPAVTLWKTCVLLAASLTIGVFVGQSQWGADTVPAIAQLAGFTLPATADQLALADIHVEQSDEE